MGVSQTGPGEPGATLRSPSKKGATEIQAPSPAGVCVCVCVRACLHLPTLVPLQVTRSLQPLRSPGAGESSIRSSVVSAGMRGSPCPATAGPLCSWRRMAPCPRCVQADVGKPRGPGGVGWFRASVGNAKSGAGGRHPAESQAAQPHHWWGAPLQLGHLAGARLWAPWSSSTKDSWEGVGPPLVPGLPRLWKGRPPIGHMTEA